MDRVHGVVHGPGPWGGPWTGSMGWSMDPGPCFVYVLGRSEDEDLKNNVTH